MRIALFGAGDIAEKGIVPVVGGELIPHSECDVTDYWQVKRAFEVHQPEVVIVTAGVSYPESVKESNPGNWIEEIETNLIGSYRVAKEALERDVKTLIFIASVAGLYGKPHHSGYSASKGGVRSLVQSLAMEGHNAYSISPGRVDTRMRERDYGGEDKRTRLEPKEIGILVKEILSGKWEPGDDIIIRRIGYETVPPFANRGEPWKDYLKVGQPPAV